jgi:argininosuccinate lyase
MAQLWNKGYDINREILEFTVGNDYELDQLMVKHDIYGSIAQAAMLKKIGILTAAEFKRVHTALVQLEKAWSAGKFTVQLEDEDGHTAIENHLVKTLCDLGKKIHTARSRNDQVVTMTRLYTKEKLMNVYGHSLTLANNFLTLAKRYQTVPMPGYTHMQRAMPTSGGVWFSQYAEAILDDLQLLKTAFEYNDMSPLGSAAGFGVNIPIDRAYTAKLMGFKKVQNNTMYVSYTRGKVEAAILFALNQLMQTMAKFANDVLMFSMSEFGFVELPKEYCTGSSLMPQKRNGDVFELTRGKANIMLGYFLSITELQNVLLSGYNRDSQLTKDLLVKALHLYSNTVKVMSTVTTGIKLNKAKCIAACSPEVFATDKALDLVKQGMPFRDAYRHVAAHLDELEAIDPVANIKAKGLNLKPTAQAWQAESNWLTKEQRRWKTTVQGLLRLAN